MGVLDVRGLPIWANLALFCAAGGLVWIAGTQLARYVDRIGQRTGLSHAFLGMALLGVATSLPEMATVVTGSIIGNTQLVLGNLFGVATTQVAMLALVDLIAVKGALTFVSPHPVLLFQGVMMLLLLALAQAGAAVGDPIAVASVGLTPVLAMGCYLLTIRVTSQGDYLPRWQPTHVTHPAGRVREDENEPEPTGVGEPLAAAQGEPTDRERWSATKLYTRCAVAAGAILLAGLTVTLTADALAQQTGLGSTFIGVVLVALSTSLPELSTTLTAVRDRNYEMAVSNILGTNCLAIALLLPADMAYRDGPILAAMESGAQFAAAMGMLATCVLLLGLLERRNRTVGRIGVDALAMLVLYVVAMGGLYILR